MNEYKIIILREKPELAPIAAEWFHCKWGVPTEAYLECMEAYLSGKGDIFTPYFTPFAYKTMPCYTNICQVSRV